MHAFCHTSCISICELNRLRRQRLRLIIRRAGRVTSLMKTWALYLFYEGTEPSTPLKMANALRSDKC